MSLPEGQGKDGLDHGCVGPLLLGAGAISVAVLFFKLASRRQETGTSLSEWRQQATVVTTLSRLASGEPVTAVALDCGYSNAGAFSSMFRRISVSFDTV